ncbi:hypothetical protein AAF189_005795 [Pseudomonas aeruginosa]
MNREGALDQLQGLIRGYGIYMAQPLDRFVGLVTLNGEADMLHLVAPWAERYQSIQALDEAMVIVVPDLVALDGVMRPSAQADLAAVVGSLKAVAFQLIPGGIADVRSDIAVPAGSRD